MKVQCVHCSQQYEVQSERLGKTVACTACGKDFVVVDSTTDTQGASNNKQTPAEDLQAFADSHTQGIGMPENTWAQESSQTSGQGVSPKSDTDKRLLKKVKTIQKSLESKRTQQDADNSITSGDGFMALFDFKFCKFISPSLMCALYRIWFWISLLGAIGAEIYVLKSLFGRNSHPMFVTPMVITMIVIPIAWILNLIVVRAGFELAMAIFNMERLARQIEENTRR